MRDERGHMAKKDEEEEEEEEEDAMERGVLEQRERAISCPSPKRIRRIFVARFY